MIRPPVVVTLVVGLVVLVSGCSNDGEGPGRDSSGGPSAQQCDEISRDLLSTVQAYVDSYAPALEKKRGASGSRTPGSPSASPSGEATPQIDVQAALQRAQEQLAERNCSLKQFRQQFSRGLDRVKARGPLAQAILLRLTASMTGTLGTTPEEVRIGPGDDIPGTLARLASGSTVHLRHGSYRLSEPLVLLGGVHLEGAGARRTTISSPAAGSAVLLLTDEVVRIGRMTLRHVGRTAASVLVTSPGSRLALTDATIAGGRSTAKAPSAGNGVAMTSGRAVSNETRTSLEVTRATFSDNSAAGVLLTGDHRASIRGAHFVRNGQCGVCFGGASSGAVRDSTFAENTVGVAVFGTARPLLEGDRFIGGEVAVQVTDRGAPVIREARVEAATRAAMIFGGTSRGRVSRSTCVSVSYGIVVSKKALPYLGRNDCGVAAAG